MGSKRSRMGCQGQENRGKGRGVSRSGGANGQGGVLGGGGGGGGGVVACFTIFFILLFILILPMNLISL